MTIAAEFDLLAFLRKNMLLTAAQLEVLEQDKSRDFAPEALAEELCAMGVLTSYQRDRLLEGEGQKLIIGPYRLMEPLGEGGMGVVFKAWQPRLDRTVALKLIRPQVLAVKPEVLTRFHREAKAIAQLAHPNMVMLYDADELDGIHYIAMEYVDGMTLEKMVRSNGPLAIKQACEYLRQSALALQHAAECGMVHRDIKPSNILVTHRSNAAAKRSSSSLRRPSLVTIRDRDLNIRKPAADESSSTSWGLVKILDMGLARLNESIEDPSPNTPLTRAGALLGTPDFISPEQARDASAVDIRSDLYSLGCTFYYMLTGRPPFPGGTDVQKILRHQTDTPVSLEEMRPNIPMPVVTITRRLLMKRPEDRFASPKQLADLLDQYLNGRDYPLPAAPISPLEDAPPDRDDVASVAAVTESQLLDSLDPEAGTPLPIADVYTETAGSDNRTSMGTMNEVMALQSSSIGTIAAHNGIVTCVSMARHGRLCVSGGLDGTARVWDISKSTAVELAMLPRVGTEIQAVALAPDEPYVIVGGTLNNQARIWRWDYQDQKVYDWGTFDEKHGVNCIHFSADGRMVTFSIGHIIYTQRIAHRNYSGRSTLKGHNNLIRSLAVSPDRRLVASGSEGRNIRIWSNGWLGSSSKAKLDGHSDIVTAIAFSPNSKRLASAGQDRTVVLWDALTPRLDTAVPLMGHSNTVRLLHFLPGNQNLLSVGEAGEVFLWNLNRQERVAECKTGQIVSGAMSISENGRRLAAATSDGRVQLFDLALPVFGEQNPRTMLASGVSLTASNAV